MRGSARSAGAVLALVLGLVGCTGSAEPVEPTSGASVESPSPTASGEPEACAPQIAEEDLGVFQQGRLPGDEPLKGAQLRVGAEDEPQALVLAFISVLLLERAGVEVTGVVVPEPRGFSETAVQQQLRFNGIDTAWDRLRDSGLRNLPSDADRCTLYRAIDKIDYVSNDRKWLEPSPDGLSPLVREDVYLAYGRAFDDLFAPVTEALDDPTVQALADRVRAGSAPRMVARDFLRDIGLLPGVLV
ncbi:hypothetical protein GCM10027020_14830 [Nocardioides salsibiostraticola]